MNEKSKHYVYKIINLLNNKEYIGVRSHPEPKKDKYMGSGTCIINVINIEGVKNFKKIILKEFENREEAVKYESSLLTEEYCNSPNTYNIINTGSDGFNKHCFRKDLWYDYYGDIRKKYRNGISLKKIGEKYNCDKGTIKNICSDILRSKKESQQLRFIKEPLSPNRNKELDQKTQQIISLYKKGLTLRDISKIFKTSHPMIRRRLLENNISLRKKGRKFKNEKNKN